MKKEYVEDSNTAIKTENIGLKKVHTDKYSLEWNLMVWERR